MPAAQAWLFIGVIDGLAAGAYALVRRQRRAVLPRRDTVGVRVVNAGWKAFGLAILAVVNVNLVGAALHRDTRSFAAISVLAALFVSVGMLAAGTLLRNSEKRQLSSRARELGDPRARALMSPWAVAGLWLVGLLLVDMAVAKEVSDLVDAGAATRTAVEQRNLVDMTTGAVLVLTVFVVLGAAATGIQQWLRCKRESVRMDEVFTPVRISTGSDA